jgi:hypothetical protein
MELKFNSIYKPSLNDDPVLLIRLDKDGKAVIVNGCKSPVGNYKAFEDGSISFSPFAITGQFCKNDKDSVYINALMNSVRFEINADGMILYSKEGKQIMTLTPVKPSDPSGCRAGEVMTPSGCWSSCADPRFQKCPDVFLAIYKPDFCAYTSDGKYVSETFECQACQRKDAFAVRKGACSCDFVKCKKGEAC